MKTNLVYRSPFLYEMVMLGLYGRHYGARYRAVGALIPAGASVLDVCCGPGVLYHRHLREKGVRYTGLDANPGFVARVIQRGGQGEVRRVRGDEALPLADFVVMQGSLYQFLPDAAPIVEQMLRAARRQVIIAEPVRNLASSKVGWVAALARRSTNLGAADKTYRFTEQTLEAFFTPYRSQLVESFLIPGGRDKVYVLGKR
jgi:SAM-dependent methyltransferase